MSQIYKNLVSGGPLPPEIPTQFTADDGTIGVPVANNFNLFSNDTTANNVNGIRTTTVTNGSANHFTQLTNRLQGSGTTIGAATTPIVTIALGATPGNYAWEFYVTGYESTGPSGTAYNIMSCVRTTGAAATLVGTSDETYVEDAALGTSDIQVVVSGNNMTVNAIGIGGLTINWNVVGIYVFIN